MNKEDLALENLQWLKYHKIKPNLTKNISITVLFAPTGQSTYIS